VRDCLATTSCISVDRVLDNNKEFNGFNQLLIHICHHSAQEYLLHEPCYERPDVIVKLGQCLEPSEVQFDTNNCRINQMLLQCVKDASKVCGGKTSNFTFEIFQLYVQAEMKGCHTDIPRHTVNHLSTVKIPGFTSTELIKGQTEHQVHVTDRAPNSSDSHSPSPSPESRSNNLVAYDDEELANRNESQMRIQIINQTTTLKEEEQTSVESQQKILWYYYVIGGIIGAAGLSSAGLIVYIILSHCSRRTLQAFYLKMKGLQKKHTIKAQQEKIVHMYSMVSMQRSPSISEPL